MACLLAWLLAIGGGAPISAVFVTVAAVVWLLLYRYTGVSASSVGLSCVGIIGLGLAFAIPDSLFAVIPCLILGLFSLLFFLAAAVGFVVAAARNPSARVANCAGCVLAIMTLILPVAVHRAIHSRLYWLPAIERTNHTIVMLHQLGADVEAFRARHGRLPKDEAELVSFRGKPMPAFYQHYQIRYYPHDKDRYHLICSVSDFWGCGWDLFGWGVLYYGPQSPQRLHADLF